MQSPYQIPPFRRLRVPESLQSLSSGRPFAVPRPMTAFNQIQRARRNHPLFLSSSLNLDYLSRNPDTRSPPLGSGTRLVLSPHFWPSTQRSPLRGNTVGDRNELQCAKRQCPERSTFARSPVPKGTHLPPLYTSAMTQRPPAGAVQSADTYATCS